MTSRERALQLEHDLAELLDGKLTPGSGSKGQKGDVKSSMFLGEAKYREQGEARGSYVVVDLQWLETIWEHARRDGRHPVLAIENLDGDRAVLISWGVYCNLGGEKSPSTSHLDQRGLRISRGSFLSLPLRVTLNKIEVSEPEWVILSWGEMLELRKANQPRAETPSSFRKGPGFKTRSTRMAGPVPWRKRSFR